MEDQFLSTKKNAEDELIQEDYCLAISHKNPYMYVEACDTEHKIMKI